MKNLLKEPDLFRNAAFIGGEWVTTTRTAPTPCATRRPVKWLPICLD